MRLPNYELIRRTERLIASECAKSADGAWQVTYADLARRLDEDNRGGKMWRIVNYLAQEGKIIIIKAGNQANRYQYIGERYQVSTEYERVAETIHNIISHCETLDALLSELRDKDERMLQALKGLKLVGETPESFLYTSKRSVEEQCYDMGVGKVEIPAPDEE